MCVVLKIAENKPAKKIHGTPNKTVRKINSEELEYLNVKII
jgi:hypothetical protein